MGNDARIAKLKDRTTEDERTGAMRSVQSADICLPVRELQAMWEPMYLERLARTYWRFLTRITLGFIRVVYTETERYVVLLARPFKLLTFKAPEYEMDSEHGTVRWRIERGVLVARNGRGGHGHLEIEVRRLPDERAAEAKVHVRVEVANFHPAIATGLGKRVYYATQAKIHVLVTNGFLRSLRKLDLAQSKVGLLTPQEQPTDAGPSSADAAARAESPAGPR